MFGHKYSHKLIRKYVALMGTLLNDIWIQRIGPNNTTQLMKIPLTYGPKEKFLARLKEDPDLTRQPAIQLPRIGFEITNITYDSDRRLPVLHRNSSTSNSTTTSVTTQYVPMPYNIDFEVTVISKTSDDATKIVEQILPFFTPQWTVRAKTAIPIDTVIDIPIVLKNVNSNDSYDDAFTERRAVMYTLQFTMKAHFFGPASSGKIIKEINIDMLVENSTNYMDPNSDVESINIQPALLANGQPTTDRTQSVPLNQIDRDDPYGVSVLLSTIDDKLA